MRFNIFDGLRGNRNRVMAIVSVSPTAWSEARDKEF
jgi:hypothetical protein